MLLSTLEAEAWWNCIWRYPRLGGRNGKSRPAHRIRKMHSPSWAEGWSGRTVLSATGKKDLWE